MLTWSTKLTVVVVVETAKPEQQWRWPNNLHIALFSISSYLCFIILSSQSGILLSPYRAKITAQSQRKKEQKLINKQHKPLMTCKLCPYQTNDQYRLRTHTEVVHQGVKRHKWVCQIFTSILSIISFIISFISFQSLWARNTSQQLSRIIFGGSLNFDTNDCNSGLSPLWQFCSERRQVLLSSFAIEFFWSYITICCCVLYANYASCSMDRLSWSECVI